MKRKYEQQYRSEWQENPLFSAWLSRYREDNCSAFCKASDTKILPRMASIKNHSNSAKHNKNMIGFSGSSQIDKYFKKTTLEDEVKKAEMLIVACLVEHNVPFRIMDHMSEIINRAFHDSEIAKKFSCKRTKSAGVAYNAIGDQYEEMMIVDLKSGSSKFSIIIDESTDVSTKKVLAIAIKYYSKNDLRVKTRLLSIVTDVEEFWATVSKIQYIDEKPKYENISNFAKHMLCLPVSNAKCERIFSSINRIKTEDRNRFCNINVRAILHGKEGLKEAGSCTNFIPSPSMLRVMKNDKILYKNVKKSDD